RDEIPLCRRTANRATHSSWPEPPPPPSEPQFPFPLPSPLVLDEYTRHSPVDPERCPPANTYPPSPAGRNLPPGPSHSSRPATRPVVLGLPAPAASRAAPRSLGDSPPTYNNVPRFARQYPAG